MFYVYFHYLPGTEQVFYVGIGKADRFREKDSRNKYWQNTVSKYGGFDYRIIHANLSIEEAHKLEKMYIAKFGRKKYEANGILVNLAEGGQGNKGFRKTELMMPVVSFDMNGNMVKRYESMESTKEDGLNPTCVRFCITGKNKTYKNMVWIKESEHSIEKVKQLICQASVLRKKNPEKTSENCKNGQNRAKIAGTKFTRPLLVYDKYGELIGRYLSARDASMVFGYSNSFITALAKGKKNANKKGLIFRYE